MKREIEIRYIIRRNGAYFGSLQPIGAPQLRCDDSSALKMSLSGDFAPNDLADWLRDEIQPVLILDGVEYPLAVLMPATVTPKKTATTASLHIEAYDRCWRVQDVTTEDILHLAAGANYVQEIQRLLVSCGIDTVMATQSDAVFEEDREDWDIGTSYLEIVNQLLGEINYNPLWFNPQGAAVLEPVTVPSASRLKHVLDESVVESMLLPQISRETDIYRAPNVFLCVCSNPDKSGPLISKAENTNPQSPLSIPRRGRRIMKRIQVNNIESQDALDAYAAQICNESMIGGETIRVQTGLLPGFGVADVTALKYEGVDTLCVEKAWSMSLEVGGTMQHTLQRVVINIDQL